MVILLAVVLQSVLGPRFVDVKKVPGAVMPSQAPGGDYPLGTDSQGCDMLAVMVVAIPQTPGGLG
ncbi:MAG: hypothetical protein U0350_26560 [Caldilineaceae bacterium]